LEHDPEQDQECFFKHSGFKILMFIYTVRKMWRESNRSRSW